MGACPGLPWNPRCTSHRTSLSTWAGLPEGIWDGALTGKARAKAGCSLSPVLLARSPSGSSSLLGDHGPPSTTAIEDRRIVPQVSDFLNGKLGLFRRGLPW